jgi:hypothetical protein
VGERLCGHIEANRYIYYERWIEAINKNGLGTQLLIGESNIKECNDNYFLNSKRDKLIMQQHLRIINVKLDFYRWSCVHSCAGKRVYVFIIRLVNGKARGSLVIKKRVGMQ